MSQIDLEQQNIILKQKLLVAQNWMQKEVHMQIAKIAREKKDIHIQEHTNTVFIENIEEDISRKIVHFFWEILLLNISESVVENIISAELSYYHLQENSSTDGLWVITSYHKVLDTLIESFITKGFRKFALKKWQKFLRKNDVLEKTLHSVVTQWYILWVGRLFHLLKTINQWKELFDYGHCFQEYLKKYSYLEDILLDPDFYRQFQQLIESEILWKKRHVWRISFDEVSLARKIFIGDFESQNCIIYKLIKTQEVL